MVPITFGHVFFWHVILQDAFQKFGRSSKQTQDFAQIANYSKFIIQIANIHRNSNNHHSYSLIENFIGQRLSLDTGSVVQNT
jgi:hypothetical protein